MRSQALAVALILFAGSAQGLSLGFGLSLGIDEPEPSLSVVTVHAQTGLTWFDGSPIFNRAPPPGTTVYAFRAHDAPAAFDATRLGAPVRIHHLNMGGGFVSMESQYDVNGDGLFMPHERVYHAQVGNPFTDVNGHRSNTAIVVDVQTPKLAWIDYVKVSSLYGEDEKYKLQNLGFEEGDGTIADHWTPEGDWPPARDTTNHKKGDASAMFATSRYGSESFFAQSFNILPGDVSDDDYVKVSFELMGESGQECGASIEQWRGDTNLGVVSFQHPVTPEWTKVKGKLHLHEELTDATFRLFCTAPAEVLAPTEFEIFMVMP